MTSTLLARLLALLTAGLLLAVAPLPAVASGTEESDDERDDNEKEQDDEDEGADDEGDDDKRKVAVSIDSDGVEIKLERETAASEDKIKVRFDFEDAEFETKYESETGDAETEMKLQAQLLELAEYRDANNNSRYDAGEPIVSTWSFSDEGDDEDDNDVPATAAAGTVRWGTPTVSDVTVDNQTGKKIRVPAQIGSGQFELVLWVFGDFVDLENSTLKPTSVKIDILIHDYPYRANDTALALFLQTESKTEFEVEHDHDEMEDDEEGVAASEVVGGEPVSLVFTWKDSATVDGASKPVYTTSLRTKTETETEDGESETERKELFALSYARGKEIIHDPESYVAIEPASSGNGIPGWTGPAALAAVALAALASVRSRRKP